MKENQPNREITGQVPVEHFVNFKKKEQLTKIAGGLRTLFEKKDREMPLHFGTYEDIQKLRKEEVLKHPLED